MAEPRRRQTAAETPARDEIDGLTGETVPVPPAPPSPVPRQQPDLAIPPPEPGAEARRAELETERLSAHPGDVAGPKPSRARFWLVWLVVAAVVGALLLAAI